MTEAASFRITSVTIYESVLIFIAFTIRNPIYFLLADIVISSQNNMLENSVNGMVPY
jgi:hypothetical protein